MPSQVFRYPTLYRVQALLGVLLFGLLISGSVLAEVDAVQHGRADALLHPLGAALGLAGVLLGLDIVTRSITVTEQGLEVNGLRAARVPWAAVKGWRYGPLSLIHVRFEQGRGLWLWPILDHYSDLLRLIDQHAGR